MTESLDRETRFRRFVETHRSQAVGFAWRLLGRDADAAEDVAQQAFMRAWRGLDGFRGDAELSTWFYRILVRQVRSHQRRMGVRRRWAAMTGAAVEMAVSPMEPDAGLRKRIAEALSALSAGQREAFVLIHLEGLTITETAAVLGRAPGTIKSHLHRALRSMRSTLGDLKEAGDE
jgi:RNA polymerase sigma-70 factor (ECF subfamily)